MNPEIFKNLVWNKMNGFIPAIVQHATTSQVLMLGFMNQTALQQTLDTQWVTFYSRSKQRLWIKGETSGNKLALQNILVDCDQDALLILALPEGPTCHFGQNSCFGQESTTDWQCIQELTALIQQRKENLLEDSYISSLYRSGLKRIAQKVGEEATETVIEALADDKTSFCNEAADLLFHLLILIEAKGQNINDVIAVLKQRKS